MLASNSVGFVRGCTLCFEHELGDLQALRLLVNAAVHARDLHCRGVFLAGSCRRYLDHRGGLTSQLARGGDGEDEGGGLGRCGGGDAHDECGDGEGESFAAASWRADAHVAVAAPPGELRGR